MRLIFSHEKGALGLSYTWLPTWMGMNPSLMKEVDASVEKRFVGEPMTEATLDKINEYVIDLLCAKFPIKGLREFLDSLKYVNPEESDAPRQDSQAESAHIP